MAPVLSSRLGSEDGVTGAGRMSWSTWKAYITLALSAAPWGPWVQTSNRVRRPSTRLRSLYSSPSRAASIRSSIR
jgi:hypothetical protein